MSQMRGEIFALDRCGMGRAGGAARVLAQRLASFTPQQARRADPMVVARAAGMAGHEIDLTALEPRAQVEEGGPSPGQVVTPDRAIAAIAPAPSSAPQAAAGATATPGPGPRAIDTAEAPSVRQTGAETTQASVLPVPQRQARDEVFALSAPPSVASPAALPAPRWGLAGAGIIPATAPAPAPQTPEVRNADVFPLTASDRPPSAAAGMDQATAAVSEPVPVLLSNVPDTPAPVPANATLQSLALRELRHDATPATTTPAARSVMATPASAAVISPLDLSSQPAPQHPAQSASTRPALPVQAMGRSEAVAAMTLMAPSNVDHRLLERLAEGARKRADDVVVHIGSVSVVMRPASPVPAPQAIAAPAPPASAAPPRVHRNPWLGHGRGGE